MKKVTKTALALLLVALLLVACGAPQSASEAASADAPASSAAAEVPAEGSEAAEPAAPGAIDTSEAVELKMVLVGEKPPAADAVFGKVSEMLSEDINATLAVEYISLADYVEMYSLTLASGDPIDIMYTSGWCYYAEEASKGAFKPIDFEFIQTYLPEHWAQMPESAWTDVALGGTIYTVPCNYNTISGFTALIRGDLRKQYGMDEITSVEMLEEYYSNVVANNPELIPYDAAQHNDHMRMWLLEGTEPNIAKDGMFNISERNGDSSADMPEISFTYSMPEYADFAKLMKKWCDMGFWSKNAIANAGDVRESFQSGAAASMVWNIYTVGAAAQYVMESSPEWEPEVLELFPEAGGHARGTYLSDSLAFPISGLNTERAAMAIDLFRFDREYYDLIRYGIEGESWIPDGDTGWSPGPAQQDYVFDQISWGFKNINFERVNVNEYPPVVESRENWYAWAEQRNFTGFVLDETNVATEMAALTNLRSQYAYLLDLGAVDDVDATLAEFNAAADAAGLQKVIDEIGVQLKAFYETRGI